MGERNGAYKHGLFTKDAKAARRDVLAELKAWRALFGEI
jgi:hypothetical protein